jgi:kinesin family protein 5
MNKNSSRSHAILQIFVEQRWVEKDPQGTKASNEVKKYFYRKALCTVVDLAGSERLSKTGSEGMRLQEAKTINKSIAALSNCISALSSKQGLSYVPFRDSKLTRLLTESLGGNCKTTICACISPSMAQYDESYSTLLFATRAMSVRTIANLNQKVEYKFGEGGKAMSQNIAEIYAAASQNEIKLMTQNSQLLTQTAELKQEVQQLRDSIRRAG